MINEYNKCKRSVGLSFEAILDHRLYKITKPPRVKSCECETWQSARGMNVKHGNSACGANVKHGNSARGANVKHGNSARGANVKHGNIAGMVRPNTCNLMEK